MAAAGVGLVAFAVALVGTYLLTHPRAPLAVLDHPNERSLHERPVPRTGGLAILAGAVAGSALGQGGLAPAAGGWWVLAGALLVAGVSFVDDLRSLPVLARLAAQALAAGLLVRGGLAPATLDLPGLAWALPPLAGAALAVGYTVWMANLYNFMDGMDGFAGGMAVFGFGTLAVLGAQAGEAGFALACVAVAAAAAGFLALNFPPARIFMGDVGSSTLGFLAAALSLWGARAGLFPLWAAVLAFSPFIADATVTLFRRLLAGEKIWQAHRCHYYQRLVRLGWGHRKTVLAEYLLMLACALSAVLAARGGLALQWAALAAWAFGYAGLALAVGRLERGAGVEAAP